MLRSKCQISRHPQAGKNLGPSNFHLPYNHIVTKSFQSESQFFPGKRVNNCVQLNFIGFHRSEILLVPRSIFVVAEVFFQVVVK